MDELFDGDTFDTETFSTDDEGIVSITIAVAPEILGSYLDSIEWMD